MLSAHYDGKLVLLSLVMAICSAYTALDLAGRTASLRGRERSGWIIAGAASMGLGIWAMHYIGMLAYLLTIPVTYSLPLVAASLRLRLHRAWRRCLPSAVESCRLSPWLGEAR